MAIPLKYNIGNLKSRKVSTLIAERFPATLELAVAAAVIALGAG